MFTGIVEDIGVVKSVDKKPSSGRIEIKTLFAPDAFNDGDSVAVNGLCLTVTSYRDGVFTADVSGETLNRTTLGELKTGDRVNLEKPLTLNKPMGGHMVTGHVDCVGEIASVETTAGGGGIFEFSLEERFLNQVVDKGSIAIDGVSLTIASQSARGVKVAIIPHTLKATILESKRAGSRVNIETDIIGKYVEKFGSAYGLSGSSKGVTEEYLKEHGFIKGE